MIQVMVSNMALKKRILQMILIKMNLSHTQSSNPPSISPKKSTKSFLPYELWGGLPEAAKEIIEYNKKMKVVSPKPYLNWGQT